MARAKREGITLTAGWPTRRRPAADRSAPVVERFSPRTRHTWIRRFTSSAKSSAWLKVPRRELAVVRVLAASISVGSWPEYVVMVATW